MKLGKKIRLKNLLLVGASCLIAMPALAQPVQQEETVVVTARKREETIQKTPLAITAFTADSIKSQKVETLADVAKLTPGLNFTPLFGIQNQLPIIRGASQTFGALNVGVFLDGVYLSGKSSVDLELNDLQRIEVVKGPQSALYGRNTFSGAINYVTKAPSKEFSGNAELTAGTNGLAKGVFSISGPLGDVFSYRIGAFAKSFDGYYTSAIDGGKVDFSESIGGTVVLYAKPADNFRAVFRVTASKDDSGQPPSSVIRTNSDLATPPGGSASQQRNLLYRGALPTLPENGIFVNTIRRVGSEVGEYGNRADSVRASLDLRYDLEGMRISSLSSYSHRNNEFTLDGDNTICDRAGGCPNFGFPFAAAIPLGTTRFATSSADEAAIDVSQELRLESLNDGPLKWLLGVFYYKNDSKSIGRSLSFGTTGVNTGVAGTYSFPKATVAAESWSGFGSIGYDFSDKFSVTAEVRYEKEDQLFNRTPTSAAPFADGTGLIVNACKPGVTPAPTDASRCVFRLENEFEFVTPRVTANYEITPDAMVFATVGKGTKVGGFNDATNITFDQRQYKEEESLNYELGVKTNWLNNTVKLNGSIYYTDWSNQQAACQNPATSGGTSTSRTYTCNVGASEIFGAELDFAAVITNKFSIAANYSYTDATYSKFIDLSLAGTLAILGQPALDFNGKFLPYVPMNKLVISPRYKTQFMGMNLELRADVSSQDKTWVRADNMQWFNPRTTIDLRATLSNNNWRIQAFIDNAMDDDTTVTGNRFFDSVNYSVAAPLATGPNRRLSGITLGYKF